MGNLLADSRSFEPFDHKSDYKLILIRGVLGYFLIRNNRDFGKLGNLENPEGNGP